MKRYLIEEAKCDLANASMPCRPGPTVVVASVRVDDGTKKQWLTLAEIEGIPNYILTDEDIFDRLIDDDFDDDFNEFLNAHNIGELDGIDLTDEYGGAFDSMVEHPESPAIPLLRYVIALVRCEMDEIRPLVDMARGRYADELDIPMSDLEEEWSDEMDGEEDDEEEDEDGDD